MPIPTKEFNICILGASNVGKTCICERLIGKAFVRKPSKQSLEDTATRYSLQMETSAGLILFHIYDWAWEVKRRDESINQQLMRGNDGAIYVYDITDRRTLRDFLEYADWYQRAAGFDKPYVIVSNKNDQKKRVVQDVEGQSLARSGDRRTYAAVSLADDTGIDDLGNSHAKFISTKLSSSQTAIGLCRVMMQDLNLSVSSYLPASEESLAWSDERAAARTASIGLGLSVDKAKRVLLLVLNRSIGEKFVEAATGSEYTVETVGSLAECEEEFASASGALPVVALAIPPSSPESQQLALKELAGKLEVGAVVSIPRDLVATLRGAGL